MDNSTPVKKNHAIHCTMHFQNLFSNLTSTIEYSLIIIFSVAILFFETNTFFPFWIGIIASVGIKMAFLTTSSGSFISAYVPGNNLLFLFSVTALTCNVLVEISMLGSKA